MNIKKELSAMQERMLSDELMNALISECKREMELIGYEGCEQEYQLGAAALAEILDDKQKAELAQMEKLCLENIKYGMRFGFSRGVYAGFQQFFVSKTTKRPFRDFVEEQIMKEPQMKLQVDYYQRRTNFNKIFNTLEEQLDAVAREHLISIYSTWEERLFGVLRHSFYLGYRYALSLAENVEPLPPAAEELLEKKLLTEHELSITLTREERKREEKGWDE